MDVADENVSLVIALLLFNPTDEILEHLGAPG